MRSTRWSFVSLLVLSIFALAACGDDEAAKSDPLEVAALTAEPTSGQAPLEVTFTADVGGGSSPYEATWNFGEETEEDASGLEVAHTYYREGTYEVQVSVTDGKGSTAQKSVEVTVEPADPPTVTATASPEMGIAPLDTTFEVSAEGGSGEFEYAWSFGDGSSSEEQNPAHRYIIGGTYTASVTVTDVLTEKVTTEEISVEVADDETPFVSATADPARGIAPLNVSLGSQVFGGNAPLTYTWDFGDGTDTVDGESPSHEYTDPGSYKAVVTVEDADGDLAYSEVTIEVLDNAVPSVDVFAEPTSGIAPLTVQFDPQAQGGEAPLSFAWDFGNGDTADTRKPSYQFTDPGTHTVTVVATDGNGDTATGTIDIEVTSDEVPTVNATATPTSGLAPVQVQFDATATGGNGALTYTWNFGEGSTDTGEDPVHTYQSAGQYTATVTVRDENGDTASATVDIDVGDDMTPTAAASASPTSGRAPLPVDFFANATGGNGALSYAWDFGDGNTDTAQTPSHTFSNPGTYNVSLVVTDADGSSDQSTVTIDVLDNAEPTVSASATPDTGIAPVNVEFDANVTAGDAPFTYSWDFGDGSATQTVQRPSHSYTAGGTYTATVTVTDDDGDTTSDTVDVTIADNEVPIVDGSADTDTGTAPLTVNFTAAGTGGNNPLSYTWYFGDGSAPVDGASATHTYQNAGVFEASVIVTDANGDTSRDTVMINVRPVAPDLVVESIAATRNSNDVDFEIVLRNDGTSDVVHPFDVRLYYDESQAPTASTASDRSRRVNQVIPVGGTYTVDFTSFDFNIGTYESYVLVDPRQEVPDLDRSNNVGGPESFMVDGLLVSEVYYDTVGADDPDQTFIELFGPNGKDLEGYTIEAVNGSDGSVYATLTLPASTTIPSNGYFVLGSSNLAEADITFAGSNLQNGPDSVVIRDPQGNISDSVGYGDFTGVLANFAGEGQSARSASPGESIGRRGDQQDTEDNRNDFYVWSQPTPGAANRLTLVNAADTCADAYDLTEGGEGRYFIEGNLGSATNDYTTRSSSGTQGYCFSTSSTLAGPDQVYSFTVPAGETASVDVYLGDNASVDIDSVITADPCSSLDTGMIGCNPVGTEYFTLTEGTYYLVVFEDGGNNLSSSDEPYEVELDVSFQ